MAARLFLTTPTSATASYARLFSLFCDDNRDILNIAATFWQTNDLNKLTTYEPDASKNCLYIWNTLQFWNKNIKTHAFGPLLINFRDPRDLLCNQYHWAQNHPRSDNNNEAVQQRAEKIRADGIDKFATSDEYINFNKKIFRSLREIVSKHEPHTVVALTYAQICLDFDNLLDRIAFGLGLEMTDDLRARCAVEAPEKLSDNSHFVSMSKWLVGGDTAPGRHRVELSPDTIEKLTEVYKEELQFCRDHETDALKHLYA